MKQMKSEKEYQNTAEHNREVYNCYTDRTNSIDYLKLHRDIIENSRIGYGDRAFTAFWNDIVNNMPKKFKFLEIGVFKGQVISNIGLSAQRLNKSAEIYGVSPFTAHEAGFLFTKPGSYKQDVINLFNELKVSMDNVTLIEGLSQDADIIERVKQVQPFDCVYIDGDHRYDPVMIDLKIYSEFVKKDGILVIDDSANDLPVIKDTSNAPVYFQGIPDVSRACKDFFTDSNWTMSLAVGHNTMWRRIK